MIIKVRKNLFYLVFSFFTYFIGMGTARYLGFNIDIIKAVLGLVWVISLSTCSLLIRKIRLSKDPLFNRNEKSFVQNYLLILTCLALMIVVSFYFYHFQVLYSEALTLYGLTIFWGVLYIFLDERHDAFSELLIVLWISYIIPLVSFALQSGKSHTLLILNAFYLIFVLLSFMSFYQLYALKTSNLSNISSKLIEIIGFRKGILFHNFCLIFAYLTSALFFFWGLPDKIYFPIFFTLPFAAYHLWKMLKLLDESEVFASWDKLFTFYSVIIFLLLYFPLYGYWTR